jgi:2,5-diamino-6-(ribosylamino)-4(3H)-pyrimidinone 5'-phosphate reductase
MVDGLPEVVLITTTSVDGRITLGAHQRLVDQAVQDRWASMRGGTAFAERPADIGSTVVLEGSGSFVDVDAEAPAWPAPTTLEQDLWQDHLPRTAPNWFVVADSRGRVDWTFTGDGATILHVLVCRATPSGYLQRLRDLGVGYFVTGEDQVDLRLALARIHEVLGADRVIVDAGGTLNAAVLRDGLVDVVDVVTLPGLVGGSGTPTMMDGPPLDERGQPVRLQLLDVRVDGGAVRTRYRVLSSSPAPLGSG